MPSMGAPALSFRLFFQPLLLDPANLLRTPIPTAPMGSVVLD
jgi:hypothetical protein